MKKQNKKQNMVLYIIFPILCIVFVFSAYRIYSELTERQKAQNDFESLAELVTQTPSRQEEGEEPKEEPVVRNIGLLQEENPDCIGWLCIPHTTINYPVMYTPSDPEKYLRRNFDGNYSVAGVPFLDYRCSPDSDNLIIYGHNIQGGIMFTKLKNYLDADYRAEHPVIEFETAQGCSYYTVCDVRVAEETDDWYNTLEPDDGKQYLTLSTCYGAKYEKRLLVIAEKTR